MDSNKLWRVSVDRGSTICYQIWPGLVKGEGHKSPSQCENLVAIATFRQFFPAWATQYIYPDEIKPVNIDPLLHVTVGPEIGSLRIMPFLQRLGNAYGF